MGSRRARRARFQAYDRFRRLDGSHPLKDRVPDGFVSYRARRVQGGRVSYFNFALAREIGLIPLDHPERMTRGLQRAILETFALQIVNEYDEQKGELIDPRTLLPGSYMATRYLQLQHPSRTGKTSGDGRSIWNGCISGPGGTWDISSCGTGVTKLCPATAWTRRYYKTGSRVANYGCGTASAEDGLAAALMSETLHVNGIATERTLAVIDLPSGFAINVRAGRNLLRPSHFFVHSRQGNLTALRALAELWYERQVANGVLPPRRGPTRWEALAEAFADRFGAAAATFEVEYLFVWLAWDGDNVLADGGIIDYGSVRQFGLFHREYRFDDGPIYSTTITEQRRQARQIVQHVAQIRDWLITGRKRPLRQFQSDRALRRFDRVFLRTRQLLTLNHAGLEPHLAAHLLEVAPGLVERFRRAHSWWERQRTARGPKSVADGLTWDAIYSARDLMREIPARWLDQARWLTPRELLSIAASRYASRADRQITPARARRALELQRAYAALLTRAAKLAGRTPREILQLAAQRCAVINRPSRITGDSANYAARRLFLARRRLAPETMTALIRAFVARQILVPERVGPGDPALPDADSRRVFDRLLDAVDYYRHGL